MHDNKSRSLSILAVLITTVSLSSCSDSKDMDAASHFRMTTEFLGPAQALAADITEEDSYSLTFEASGNDIRNQEWYVAPIGDDNEFYRLTNRGIGSDVSLDVINDGVFDRLTLAPTEDRSGQKWRITPIEGGYCRLTTEFLGPDFSLDVTSDAPTPTLAMRTTGNFSGQKWTLTQLGMADALDDLCRAPATP